VLRSFSWRVLGALGVFFAVAVVLWLLHGGPGRTLRGAAALSQSHRAGTTRARTTSPGHVHALEQLPHVLLSGASALTLVVVATLLLLVGAAVAALRWRARRRRRYVRLQVEAYRGDVASAGAVVAMYEALHKRLLARWWRRLVLGQPSVALELHHEHRPSSAWLAVTCPAGLEALVQSALRVAYPNCRLQAGHPRLVAPRVLLRVKKRDGFIKRVKALDRFEHERRPPLQRIMTVMAACGEPAFVQLALTPAPVALERLARRVYKRREARLSRERRDHVPARDRSLVEDSELRGGLEIQHRPLFFADVRIVAADRGTCESIASELRADALENRLVERGTAVRHSLLGIYGRRVARGEGNPVPSLLKGAFAPTELAAIWQLPAGDYANVPFARTSLPIAPAPPAILRPAQGRGALRDEYGPVSIHEQLRRQNTAVPGAVEQGKSSYLVATIEEDLRRERCAIVVMDPKGDAADAALSVVPASRTCTLLDFAQPTCGFNPLAVQAPADVIADYVVGALKNLFSDADIRASSDRYLRNAIIAVLAYDRDSTLWDAARLLSVGEEGYSYRRSVGARVRTLPQFKEISEFFTAELTAQLADARSSTTAKLDAPVNKLARLLNSPSIKHVLLNDSLRVDFDRLISAREVLVIKGALGAMGAGNTSVLMQLLIGMLDAALARQQDLVPAERRVAVALKVDEAPLVINRGFAETLALKRSAGLETVACWQTDAQWTDREVRDQLDALFAHRVYFATSSARDARDSARLTMAEFSDTVRPGVERLSPLGHPDVRLRLPKHHAIASWLTPEGRQAPFIAQTVPLRVDRVRLALHADSQRERGGVRRADLRQPHWQQVRGPDREDQGPDRDDRAGEHASMHATGATTRAAPVTDVASGPGPRVDVAHTPPESFAELVELDGAQRVRWANPVHAPRPLQADGLDREIMRLIADLGHVLSSQIHGRFNASRAMTTTQRRLKRLSDAGLVERFQFHRRDGGGVPMCYVISPAGRSAIAAEEMPSAPALAGPEVLGDGRSSGRDAERDLHRARRQVHAAGWALAFERAVAEGVTLRGKDASVLSPPPRSSGSGRVPIGPADLRLPAGRVAHDFVLPDESGKVREASSFDTVRPDLTVQVQARSRASARAQRGRASTDILLDLDDRLVPGSAAKLARYDHFLAGWSLHVARYGQRAEATPLVVVVCRDLSRARECARRADGVLRACRAYAGEYPRDWEYPGRELTLFAAERDIHEGRLRAYGVARLPPEVRVEVAQGDPRAREATPQAREILDAPGPGRA
jgi:Replication-relaxation